MFVYFAICFNYYKGTPNQHVQDESYIPAQTCFSSFSSICILLAPTGQHTRHSTSSYLKLFFTHSLLLNSVGFIANYASNFSLLPIPLLAICFRSSSTKKYNSFPSAYFPIHSCFPPVISVEITLQNTTHIMSSLCLKLFSTLVHLKNKITHTHTQNRIESDGFRKMGLICILKDVIL